MEMKLTNENVLGYENIGLAGEYAVATELCRRSFYAQLTLGNHKKTDLLVESKNRIMRFSVKAKTKAAWPKVKGISQRGDRLVFVDFKGKNIGQMPDFYVLTVTKWKNVLKKIMKRQHAKGQKCHIDQQTNTLVYPGVKGHSKDWVGCAVRVDDVRQYQNQWPKP